MKRALAMFGVLALALATILVAQTPEKATLRSQQGDADISTLELNGQLFVAADEFVKAMGGTIAPDGPGFKVTLLGKPGAFAPDSQYGVVRDELIQMPTTPVVIETRPFVPWQFFRGFLASAGDLELSWSSQQKLFTVAPKVRESLSARLSVVEIEDISKVVVQLSGKTEYTITRKGLNYVIRFLNPIGAPFAEQAYNNPHLAKATFKGNELDLQVTGADVVGSSYRLDDPFRVVIDLKKGVAAVEPTGPGRGSRSPAHSQGIKTIVIDPGHGGTDTGAIGPGGLQEKDMTLALAQKLSAVLARKLKVRVILTRETDEALQLTQRTAIANQYKADLFVSIHLNSSLRKGAKGTETYFLSLEASDELARQAADRENEAETSTGATTITPDSAADLKLILWDLAQQQYLKESSQLAETVQGELSKATQTENRGVKQAPFKVLVGATMPAALVEVGFISNPDEEAKLRSDQYQKLLADSIASAIERFKTDYESRAGIAPSPAPAIQQAPPDSTANPATATDAGKSGR